MSAFAEVLKTSPEYKTLEKAVKSKKLPVGVLGVSGIHKAHIINSLCGNLGRRALVIMPDEAAATKLCEDLRVFGKNSFLYPARDFSFTSAENRSHEYEQRRINALTNILNGTADIVVCSAEAAVQRTIPPEDLKKHSLTIRRGEDIKLGDITSVLLSAGYTRADMVEGVGQFSVRGGILDLFSPDDQNPVRIEFWGDTVDTMAHFDIMSQRRTDNVDKLTLMPSTEIVFSGGDDLMKKITAFYDTVKGKGAKKAREMLQKDIDRLKNGVNLSSADKYLPLAYEENATILSYADSLLLIVCESAGVKEKANTAIKLQNEDIKYLLEDGEICRGLDEFTMTFPELTREYEKRILFFSTILRAVRLTYRYATL